MLTQANTLLSIVNAELKKYSTECLIKLEHSSFLLAISGGIDSMTMASLIVQLRDKYKFRLGFAHINHHAHRKSEEVEDFCFQYCNNNDVAFYRSDFFSSYRKNFESNSRKTRYSFLREISEKYLYHFILTAHHQDDQLETLYMKIMDGGDWLSQIGIRERMGNLRRPFLGITKKDIELHAQLKNIAWIEDPTNTDFSFRRNNIRYAQLPKACQQNSGLKEYLLNTAKNNVQKLIYTEIKLKKEQEYIIKKHFKNYIHINRKGLVQYSLVELKLFVYTCIASLFRMKVPPQSGGLWREFKSFINKSRTGSMFQISSLTFIINRDELIAINNYDEMKIPTKSRVCHNLLWFSGKFKTRNNGRLNEVSPKNKLIVPYSIYKNGIYTRNWKHGDTMVSATSQQHVSLSDLYINNKLSIYEKHIHPVVVDRNDLILWIPSLLHGNINSRDNESAKVVSWVEE